MQHRTLYASPLIIVCSLLCHLLSSCTKQTQPLSTRVSTLAGDGKSGFRIGPDSLAEFANPAGVASDAQGNIFVADYSNNRILKIAGGQVTVLAGNGVSGFKDANGSDAEFHGPTGLACDVTGNVYVADELNELVRKITPAGDVTTIAGDPRECFRSPTKCSTPIHWPATARETYMPRKKGPALSGR
jgi:sugar lactone lactonase YvrE